MGGVIGQMNFNRHRALQLQQAESGVPEEKIPVESISLPPRKRGKNGVVESMDIKLLEHPKIPVYRPGDTITGQILVECSGDLRFKSLSVTLKGFARVYAKSGLFGKGDKVEAEEMYVKEKKFIRGGMGTGARERLPEGIHEFQFDFHLPNDPASLPTSFEDHHASIRYVIVAEMKEEANTKPSVAPQGFTVVSSIGNVEDDEEARAWLESSAPELSEKSKFYLDRSTFFSGENVMIRSDLINPTDRDITPTVSLVQKCQFPHEETCTEAVTVNGTLLTPGSEWIDVCLKLPLTCPTITNCKLFSVQYEIQVYLDNHGQVSIPVTIGVYPVVDDNSLENSFEQLGEAINLIDRDALEVSSVFGSAKYTNFYGVIPEGSEPPSYKNLAYADED